MGIFKMNIRTFKRTISCPYTIISGWNISFLSLFHLSPPHGGGGSPKKKRSIADYIWKSRRPPQYEFQWSTFWANNSHFSIIERFIDNEEVLTFPLMYYMFPLTACLISESYIENLSECFRQFLELPFYFYFWEYLYAGWFHACEQIF